MTKMQREGLGVDIKRDAGASRNDIVTPGSEQWFLSEEEEGMIERDDDSKLKKYLEQLLRLEAGKKLDILAVVTRKDLGGTGRPYVRYKIVKK